VETERIDKVVKRVTIGDPRPILVVVVRKKGEDGKFSYLKLCGQFGYWNGKELCFSSARKSKNNTFRMYRPFHAEDIVSIKKPGKADLIDIANCFFGITKDIENRKRALRRRR
jgi:hypothetical protein